MLKNENEPPVNWRDRVLNSKSASFCGAKWFNGTIWLGSGATTSCHHPPPHKVDLEEIKKNPSALYNTPYKKLMRKQMLEGTRPNECEYCWKIEDLGKEHVSDRYYKSIIYTEDELKQAHQTPWQHNVNPIQLEIAFDMNCNFACSYCNASFSTTWAHDIKKHGPYQHLKSDGAGAYTHDGSWAQPYGPKNKNNPYVEAFWQWWESDLQYSLRQLRVTGGEATQSSDFWKLIDWYEAHPECEVELAVNSNLGIKLNRIKRLCEVSHKVKRFAMFTSNESVGANSEYIRDGLDWKEWIANIRYMLEHGKFHTFHCMMTINALCLSSLDLFHEALFEIREEYPGTKLDVSYNILRFPSLQSITTLPEEIREERAIHYRSWLEANKYRMREHEVLGLSRTIAYIEEVDDGHDRSTDLESRQHDFVSFYKQYDARRNKSFADAFSNWPKLVEWYTKIPTDEIPVEELTVGDATEWGRLNYDAVMEEAKNEGLI